VGSSSAAVDEEGLAAPPMPAPHGPQISKRRRLAVTVGVMVGSFLAAMEATVVGTAMPTIIASLGGIERYSWVFSAYLLTATVGVPLWGKLSDLYGRKRLYQLGVLCFLGGSVLCGVAASMTQLIIFRAVQGLGAGALVPLGMTILADVYTTEERAKIQGVFSSVWGLASIAGPLAGGFITDRLSWPWVFFINVPFALAAAGIMGAALVETSRPARPKIDYAGAVTLTAAITVLLFALVEGGALGWDSPFVVGMLVAAAALAAAFLAIERRAEEPFVPLSLFRIRTFAVTSVAGFLIGIPMFGAISFIPLFVQGTTGSSATEAGTALTPFLLSWVASAVVGGRLLLRLNPRAVVVLGGALVTAGFVLLTALERGASRSFIYFALGLVGAGMGFSITTMLISVQHTAPREQLGIATSLSQFWRSIGGAVGVAVMGAVLASSFAAQVGAMDLGVGAGGPVDPNVVLDREARAALAPEVVDRLEDALAAALRRAFAVGAVGAALALLVGFALPKRRLLDHSQAPAAVGGE